MLKTIAKRLLLLVITMLLVTILAYVAFAIWFGGKRAAAKAGKK